MGQWHDIGALTVALAAANHSWQPVYYGPNLPAEEIVAGVKQCSACAVAISIMHLLNQLLVDELCKLRRYIGEKVALFIGGRAVGDYLQTFTEVHAKYIRDFEQFSEEINALLTASAR